MPANYKPGLKKQMDTIKKSIPTTQSGSGIDAIYSILDSTHDELLELSRLVPFENHDKPLMTGKRSFRENLIHLLNVENLDSMIITQALTFDKPEVLPLHSERDIGKLSMYNDLNTNELLSYFKLRRKILMKLFLSLSNEQWQRQIIELHKSRQESVYWRARGLALHEYEHIHIIKFQLR